MLGVTLKLLDNQEDSQLGGTQKNRLIFGAVLPREVAGCFYSNLNHAKTRWPIRPACRGPVWGDGGQLFIAVCFILGISFK